MKTGNQSLYQISANGTTCIPSKVIKQLRKHGPKILQAFEDAMKKRFVYTRENDNGIIALSHNELNDYDADFDFDEVLIDDYFSTHIIEAH
ncbi:hypothetical protein HF324_33385 [Chitinophaga oryzae]|uniref:Uncharacterized protein n=1 Tax=Chitinophaga oryzae TaxID=2725414 RepID=A0AAE6ZME3_9BACT|nr:hypothetical protein [Chitinophaga oryzae]QJB34040.1 hypothetical protein HF329_23220 [Chitinophaga oryzae]QOD67399.1 hypothetical protein HF324_33385 [Chitinophaga oryzae]